MSKQLSAEWQKKIEKEADEYGEKTGCDTVGYYSTHRDRSAGYEAGAEKYALELVEAQERIKTLEDKLRMIKQQCAVHKGDNNMISEIFETADEALSPNNKQKEDENIGK